MGQVIDELIHNLLMFLSTYYYSTIYQYVKLKESILQKGYTKILDEVNTGLPEVLSKSEGRFLWP